MFLSLQFNPVSMLDSKLKSRSCCLLPPLPSVLAWCGCGILGFWFSRNSRQPLEPASSNFLVGKSWVLDYPALEHLGLMFYWVRFKVVRPEAQGTGGETS
ncbi:hypothetical protein SLA2020_041180 [Shorea laevis]